MSYRSYKFRIYPTICQEEILRKTIGSCRFVYNWALTRRREDWILNKKSISFNKSCRNLTVLKKDKKTNWLADVSIVCLQQSLSHLDFAFSNFFKKKSGYPSFKRRKSGGSAKFVGNGFSLKGNELKIAKIKTPIKIQWSSSFSSVPSSVTISQNACGQWFASFLCQEEIAKLPALNSKIGVDVGIESFATLSDGRKFSQPKKIRRLRKKLARLQKRHSRKQKGSKNRERARKKVARVHQHIADVRKDFLHKLSTQLVRENQAIALEDLAVSNMVKNRHLARAISEQGWREFRTMLEYKCEWYGRDLLVVDRFYPSSKTCSCCGAKASFGLETRQWTCGGCGANHDRDVNAAKNILAAGLVVTDSGVDGRPTKNYVLRGSRQRKSKRGSQGSQSSSLD